MPAPGTSATETDLTGPGESSPVGTPAGVIGTAGLGPAFVPVTVADKDVLASRFGSISAPGRYYWGLLAANAWLNNMQSLTFIRVLGIGDGKKRATATGIVTNAGYVVGQRLPQDNGNVGDNKFAVKGGQLGRTHFLGCYMSESAGSTVLSAAGLQPKETVAASLTSALSLGTAGGSGGSAGEPSDGETFTVLVPTAAGGSGVAITVKILGSAGSPGANEIEISRPTSNDALADRLRAAFNGSTDAAWDAVRIKYGTGAGAAAGGIAGVTASDGTTATLLNLTATRGGASGNGVTLTAGTTVTLNPVQSGPLKLAGGRGGAVPILRAVIMTPSGVLLSLSGNFSANNNLATTTPGRQNLLKGGLTGTMDFRPSDGSTFTLLLNGFNQAGNNYNFITASFDPQSGNHIANVLNTDPTNIEKKGHYLYSWYDIHPGMAVITGSGLLDPTIDVGHGKGTSGNSDFQDTVFVLTGSGARATGAAQKPDYETYSDRFATARTPFIFSQKFGGQTYDLFRIHSLDDGSLPNSQYRIFIKDIVYGSLSTTYPTFTLELRRFSTDSSGAEYPDDETGFTSIENNTFIGCNLDPTSDQYIGRKIGDRYVYFDFDQENSAQKLVVKGDHPRMSNYIRVEISDAVRLRQIPVKTIPCGFHGPDHLVTSGSEMMCLPGVQAGNFTISSDQIFYAMNQPPLPYREHLGTGEQGVDTVMSSPIFPWGVQWLMKTDPAKPNAGGAGTNESIESNAKFFPNFRKDTLNVSVGNNPGAANVQGSILDCDKFNKNKFSLENIKVKTGSIYSGRAIPEVAAWLSASYVRNGVIAASSVDYTRAWQPTDLLESANQSYTKFQVFFQGGFDGLNLFNKDMYELTTNSCRREMSDSAAQGGVHGPTVAAYRKALDIVGTKSEVDIQLLAIPGINHSSVTDYAIDTVENRFDAMYIMDIEERDALNDIITGSIGTENAHIQNTVQGFKSRNLNTSFAAAYFPNVKITVEDTDSDESTPGVSVTTNTDVPASVTVLGAFAQNDSIEHPWYAAAGFTRGALSEAVAPTSFLNQANQDLLYDADINPIVQFPGQPLMVFGQKTLLKSDSALDRVNVRRLLLYVRREVRRIARQMLFEPNRASTLARFTSLVNPILQNVQAGQGVERFKVIIDSSTTTQADIENNTVRGKIFLQPTRSVEFVSLDFVLTNAGDAFESA